MTDSTDKPNTCERCGAVLPEGRPAGSPCPGCLMKEGTASSASGTFSQQYAPPKPEELAPFFPQLEVIEFLGQGGMGAVYKSRQTKLDRLVALKVFPREMGADPNFSERFAREARALARLNHPQIVSVFDFGEVQGIYFLLMEYVDGTNLRQVLQAGRLAPAEALRIVPQICDALQFAHDEGVVHRDIKPENILLDTKGRIKIADFGLAKILDKASANFALTRSDQVMGTQGYMAPEQVEKPLEVDHRADIYSLGVVFYEMLTGELPLGRFAAPSKKVEIDVRLDAIVLRTLEKEPNHRYQRVDEVKTELQTFSTDAVQSKTGRASIELAKERAVRKAAEVAADPIRKNGFAKPHAYFAFLFLFVFMLTLNMPWGSLRLDVIEREGGVQLMNEILRAKFPDGPLPGSRDPIEIDGIHTWVNFYGLDVPTIAVAFLGFILVMLGFAIWRGVRVPRFVLLMIPVYGILHILRWERFVYGNAPNSTPLIPYVAMFCLIGVYGAIRWSVPKTARAV